MGTKHLFIKLVEWCLYFCGDQKLRVAFIFPFVYYYKIKPS